MKVFSLVILIVLFFIYGYKIFISKMKNSKISFREIIFDFNYLKNSKSKITCQDIFLFFIFPIAIGVSLIFGLGINIKINDTVITILGIVSAILLNFWVILITVDSEKNKKFIEELSLNIVMNILGTFLMIIVYLFKEIIDFSDFLVVDNLIIKIGKVGYIFLLIFSIINFLMILQRMFLIVKNKYTKK